MSDYSSITCCWFRFIFTLGFLALCIWLSVRTSKPKCSLEQFYLPSLDKSTNNNATKSNNFLFFQLNLKNKMKDKGVHYYDINLSFYYGTNTSFPIGNTTVKGFYQNHGKEAHKSLTLEIQKMPWADALKAVSNGSKAIFRVDVATRIKYKIMFWYTKKHNFVVNNKKFEIDDTDPSDNWFYRKVGSDAVVMIEQWLFSLPVATQGSEYIIHSFAISFRNTGPDSKENVVKDNSQNIIEKGIMFSHVDTLLVTCQKRMQMKETAASIVRHLLVIKCIRGWTLEVDAIMKCYSSEVSLHQFLQVSFDHGRSYRRVTDYPYCYLTWCTKSERNISALADARFDRQHKNISLRQLWCYCHWHWQICGCSILPATTSEMQLRFDSSSHSSVVILIKYHKWFDVPSSFSATLRTRLYSSGRECYDPSLMCIRGNDFDTSQPI